MRSEGEDQVPNGRSAWRGGLATPEGHILIAGFVLAVVYITAIALTSIWSGTLCHNLLKMTGSHVVGGRFAGILLGHNKGLAPWLVITASLTIEAILTMHFFPLFVLSYRKLIIIDRLKESMARAQNYAERHQKKILKFGVPGLLLFVWFPFWMTGPLVGSIIGFLIGLRPWVNMAVVIIGTGLATVSWSLLVKQLEAWLASFGEYVPMLVVGVVLLIAISIHIRQAFARRQNGKPANGGPNGQPPAQA